MPNVNSIKPKGFLQPPQQILEPPVVKPIEPMVTIIGLKPNLETIKAPEVKIPEPVIQEKPNPAMYYNDQRKLQGTY